MIADERKVAYLWGETGKQVVNSRRIRPSPPNRVVNGAGLHVP